MIVGCAFWKEFGDVTGIRWIEEADQIRLGLPADLDLPMAQTLLDALRHALNTPRAIRVDAEAVERVSTACAQILVAASRSAVERGVNFAIIHPSDALVELCADIGLADWLRRWSAS